MPSSPVSPLVSGEPMRPHDRAEMRGALERAIKQADRRALKIRIPEEEGLMQKLPGCHFHFKPEVFLQLQGSTHFRFPRAEFELRPGEMAVIPAGVPHGEAISAEPNRPFSNLVAGFYSHTVSLHLAQEVAPGRPGISAIEFFDAPDMGSFELIANNLIHASRSQAPARDNLVKGLVISLLAMFQNLVERGADQLNSDIGKIFHVKWLVREQFANPDLSVKAIAKKLQCSPDYLSHLYHQKTGERLTHYIQRIRIEGAILALESTPLYVSEIAFAHGFSDPAYFARVFKKHKGESPQDFRERLDAERRERESKPKTIYFDRVDYTHGQATSPQGAV